MKCGRSLSSFLEEAGDVIKPRTQGADLEMCPETANGSPLGQRGVIHLAGKSRASHVTWILLYVHCDKNVPKMTTPLAAPPYLKKK